MVIVVVVVVVVSIYYTGCGDGSSSNCGSTYLELVVVGEAIVDIWAQLECAWVEIK